MKPAQCELQRSIRRLNLFGFSATVLFLGGLGGWAATATLTGAVIGQGTLVVESSVKKVQHPDGGIVGQIFVKEGNVVKEGDILIRLDDTVTRSSLGATRSQLDEASAREARLLAERDGAESVTFPPEMMSRVHEPVMAAAVRGQEKLFQSRRTGKNGQQAQLREQVVQSEEQISGLIAQQQSKENEIRLMRDELAGVSQLYQQKLVNIQRYNSVQRDQARLEGERGQLISQIASARAKISETELKILQLGQDFSTDVLKELRETQGQIAVLGEKLIAAEDQLKHIDIRAPQSGTVHQLTVHTVGGVVAKGEAVMQIVPLADKLIVEAKIPPQDIDQVALGSTTTVRIMAGNQRTMVDLFGEVTHIGADLTKDKDQVNQPNNQPYYLVRVSLAEQEVARLKELTLVPGMPAEIFIRTRERTPLQYLLKPLNEQISRAFRER
jgi:membrane fusion protein, type I secretion system